MRTNTDGRATERNKATWGFFRPFVLVVVALTVFSMLALVNQTSAVGRTSASNPIAQENQQNGTTAWQPANPSATSDSLQENEPEPSSPSKRAGRETQSAQVAASPYAPKPISGYADQVSLNRGGTVTLFVSTALPTYTVDLYRMGWYGGAGARLIQTFPNLTGQNQPVPNPDPQTGLVDANWQPSLQIQTSADWVSGVYLAKLTASDGSVGYAVFVLRDDSSTAEVLYQVPVNTWQAYNAWGGKSLYDYNSPGGRASKVSFNRPYDGSGADGFFNGDLNMIEYLESQGYNVAYVTSVDVQANPNLMANHKVFLSNFHDEYWSMQMRNNVTAWRDQGKSLAFFDSNNIYWQVRFESSSAVYLRDSNFANLNSPLSLAGYGGYPVASGWTLYTIPLADLHATNVKLGAFVLHNWTDQPNRPSTSTTSSSSAALSAASDNPFEHFIPIPPRGLPSGHAVLFLWTTRRRSRTSRLILGPNG